MDVHPEEPDQQQNVEQQPAENTEADVKSTPTEEEQTLLALKLYKADIRLSHYTRERLACCQKLRLRCCAACCPLPDDDAKLHLQQKGPGLKSKKKTNKPGKK